MSTMLPFGPSGVGCRGLSLERRLERFRAGRRAARSSRLKGDRSGAPIVSGVQFEPSIEYRLHLWNSLYWIDPTRRCRLRGGGSLGVLSTCARFICATLPPVKIMPEIPGVKLTPHGKRVSPPGANNFLFSANERPRNKGGRGQTPAILSCANRK